MTVSEALLLTEVYEGLATLCERATGYSITTHLLLMEAFNELDELHTPPQQLPMVVPDKSPDMLLAQVSDGLGRLIDLASDTDAGMRYIRVRALVQAARAAA
jgi:hypothetical protein